MKNGARVVLLTGANGFVGRNLAPKLAANGIIVRQVVRKPTPDPNIFLINKIDLQTNWSEAFLEVDTVVHLAARVHRPREDSAMEAYRSINIDGTLHLARCASDAGVRQFIFLSTILVNGSSTDGRPPFRENDRPTPRGAYGMSKAAAEEGLRAIASENEMSITVIRTPLIYGSGASGNFRLLVKALECGFPLPFGSIDNQRAFLGIENLASFIMHRFTHSHGSFDVFLVADNEQISTPEFVRRMAKALGKNPFIVPFPIFALKVLFRLSRRPEANESVVGSMQVDMSKTLKTGWRPPLSLDEGLRIALTKIN